MGWLRGLFRKDFWRTFLPNGMNLNDIPGVPTEFWGCYTNIYVGFKGTDSRWNERRWSDLQNSISRKQADIATQLQTHATFHEKGRMTQRVEIQAQRIEPQFTENYSRPWNLKKKKKNVPIWISKLLGIGGSFFLPFSPLSNGNIYNYYLISVLPLYFGSKLLVF